MSDNINNDTPIAFLTVGQLKELLDKPKQEVNQPINTEKKYVYGYSGLAKVFNCSVPTAARIKASGKIDKAITQIGRKIIIDAELALELAGKKQGGRNR